MIAERQMEQTGAGTNAREKRTPRAAIASIVGHSPDEETALDFLTALFGAGNAEDARAVLQQVVVCGRAIECVPDPKGGTRERAVEAWRSARASLTEANTRWIEAKSTRFGEVADNLALFEMTGAVNQVSAMVADASADRTLC